MKKVKDAKTYYFQCDCASQDHTVGITFDIDNKEMSLEVQLHRWQSFHKRLWSAVKYIFGYECKYGHWDTTIMNEEKFLELYNLMTRFSFTAGIRDKSAKKIQSALTDVAKGNRNGVVSSGLHNSNDRNVLGKYKKEN